VVIIRVPLEGSQTRVGASGPVLSYQTFNVAVS
jgi:hypothetical protein